MFNDLYSEALLARDSILRPGNKYTFTIETGSFLQYTERSVYNTLREKLFNLCDIISANRPFFSSRFIVTINPKFAISLNDFIYQIEKAFKDMGYKNASFVMAETGEVSTAPGGVTAAVSQTITGASEVIGGAIQRAVSPIVLPIALIAGLGLISMIGRKK